MSLLVDLQNLRIDSETRTLVHNVNVQIRPQRVTALCRPSGSGKSLTARAIMGVLDVEPGIQSGSLYYPLLDPSKDWFQGVCKQGMSASGDSSKRVVIFVVVILHILPNLRVQH